MDLLAFIVAAKAATYVGGGIKAEPSRPGAHDLTFIRGAWSYRDSYFGGTDFLGQEVVWRDGRPFWAMNYYGRILLPEDIDGARAGHVVQQSLSRLYGEGRFLGGFSCQVGDYLYEDRSEGDERRFVGKEWIEREGRIAYRLDYHGGLVVP